MATLTAKAPVEPDKSGAYLHDRSRIPEAPPASRGQLLLRHAGIIAGVALSLALTALMVQTRATWETHRDWVTAAALVPMAVAGVALGYLFARNKSEMAALGAVAFVLAGVVITFNILRGVDTEGQDNLRDAMSIITAVFLAIGVICSVAGYFLAEIKDPTRAPEPQI